MIQIKQALEIKEVLDKFELEIEDNTTEYLTHQEIFSKIKGRIYVRK